MTIENSTIENNLTGIKVDSSNTTGAVDMTVADTVVAGNTNAGVSILNKPAGGPAINFMLKGIVIASYGDNQINGNTVDGPALAAVAPR